MFLDSEISHINASQKERINTQERHVMIRDICGDEGQETHTFDAQEDVASFNIFLDNNVRVNVIVDGKENCITIEQFYDDQDAGVFVDVTQTKVTMINGKTLHQFIAGS